MTDATLFRKGTKITVTRRNGEVSPAEFVSKGEPGATGVFHIVKLPNDKTINVRPSQISLAA